MASNAVSGVGTRFKRSDGESTPVFTAISEITSISGPDMSRETIDVTSLDSEEGFREFISSFRDGGQVQLEMNFTKAGYQLMLADFKSETLVDYQIVLPSAANSPPFEFSALVVNLSLNIPLDDKISAPVTLKISGPVTFESA